jgi:hypothetical protein
VEQGDHVGGLDRAEAGRADQQARVVVDQVQDLDGQARGQRPVRRIGLPELVGQRRLEADHRRARTLARLRHHEPALAEQPDDRAGRGHRAGAPSEVPLDGQRAGVEPLRQESGAQRDDLIGDRSGHRRRRAVRPARARDEPGLALSPVPRQQLVQPAPVHAVDPRELGDRPTLAQVRLDQIPPDVHPETPSAQLSPMS